MHTKKELNKIRKQLIRISNSALKMRKERRMQEFSNLMVGRDELINSLTDTERRFIGFIN